MNTFERFEKIKKAYEDSTHKANYFMQELYNEKWDDIFFADGEYYFIMKGLIFTTPSLDPFDMEWKPSGIFDDGSVITF